MLSLLPFRTSHVTTTAMHNRRFSLLRATSFIRCGHEASCRMLIHARGSARFADPQEVPSTSSRTDHWLFENFCSPTWNFVVRSWPHEVHRACSERGAIMATRWSTVLKDPLRVLCVFIYEILTCARLSLKKSTCRCQTIFELSLNVTLTFFLLPMFSFFGGAIAD